MESTPQYANTMGISPFCALVPMFGCGECIKGVDVFGVGEAGAYNIDAVEPFDYVLRDFFVVVISDEVDSCLYSGITALPCADIIGSHAFLVRD
jgi:hypothetical protein